MGGVTSIRLGIDNGLDSVALRQQLQRILASKTFARATRLRKFLEYGVEAAVEGKKANEYAIGVDVFERDTSFDPRIDPVVRVLARRLRSKLAQYYQTEGSIDLVNIELPLRSYTPVFSLRAGRARRLLAKSPTARVQYSIAVFPFMNLSPQSGDEYFADGLTREVTHLLAQVQGWRVFSWTTDGQRFDVHEVASQFGADVALCGTVRKSGEKLRISTELLVVPDRTVLWSHMFEVEIDGLVPTQEKIAKDICQALSRDVGPSANSHPARRQRYASAELGDATGGLAMGLGGRPLSGKAYQHSLKDGHGCCKVDRRSLAHSIAYLEKSIAEDPEYPQARAALAEALVLTALYAEAPPLDVMPRAKAEAERALQSDSELADARTALALVNVLYEWDFRTAESEFLRALAIAPTSTTALKWYATACLAPQQRFDEAIGHLRQAQEMDPLMMTIPSDLAFVYCATGNPDLALDQLHEYVEMEPDFTLIHWAAGLAYVVSSKYQRAISELESVAAGSGDVSYVVSSLAHACALAGETTRARAIFDRLLERSRVRYIPEVGLALVCVGLEQYGDALQHLEIARAQHCAWLPHAKIDPRFRPLHSEHRFQKVFQF